MKISHLDHLVLTVADIDRTADFYQRVLGMDKVSFGEGRVALTFGQQKINLHQSGAEFTPHAASPQPGSGDLCFIADATIGEIHESLVAAHVPISEGPVRRSGATGPIESVYFYDPDGNLIEVSTYQVSD
ncbi:MAG: VOC family protein [Pseudomonadota bacterium]